MSTKAELQQRIKELSCEVDSLTDELDHDVLTSLHCRRGMHHEIKNWLTAQVPLVTVCVMDIDRFKDYNDTNGHAGGDELLTRVATQLGRLALDHGGIAVRLGGDEFAIVIPRVDVLVAEAATQAVSEVDISVGITVGEMFNWANLLHDADVALYHSKRTAGPAFTVWVTGLTMPDPHPVRRRRVRDAVTI